MLTPLETRIMDLDDTGMSQREIATALGVDKRAVDRVLGYLADRNEDGRARKAAERGSMALAAAIAATGRSFA